MAITTYAELQTAIQNWLARSDTDIDSRDQEFITLCEAKLNRNLKIRAMETALSDTISSGVISVPADYVQGKHFYIDGSPIQVLQRVSAEQLLGLYPSRSSSGKPHYIAQDGGNFEFGPYPDSAYTVKGTYYKNIDVLSDSNTSNWWLANHPDVLLYGSLLEAAPYLKNYEEVALWKAMYDQAVQEIKRADKFQETSGSPPAVVGA